jgi:cbb3-type cytochrome oxidase maturation protein
MSIIYVLIPLAIILVGIAVIVFFWAVRSNQFEDLERQGYSILFDDDLKKKDDKLESKETTKPSEDIK